MLDRQAGRARAGEHADSAGQPARARIEPREADAIPSIPAAAIEPFLTQPLVIDQATLDSAPRIVATRRESRGRRQRQPRLRAWHATANVGDFWQVFRPGEPLVDPDSNESLGYEAVYLGDARVRAPRRGQHLEIVKSNQEMYIGDRMFAAPKPVFTSYVPRAPEKADQGPRHLRIRRPGRDRGKQRRHVEQGHARRPGSRQRTGGIPQPRKRDQHPLQPRADLGISQHPVVGTHRATGSDDTIRSRLPETNLPPERHALVFVFRTFEKVSYALVMQANAPINVLDRHPESLDADAARALALGDTIAP